MKKLVYLFITLIGLSLTGCEPMEDIHEEVDAVLEAEPTVGAIDYTLTEEDYTDEDDGLGLQYPNFNSVDDAKLLVPELLEKKFPVWGDGSLANVFFDLYAPQATEDTLIVYTVSTEDYDSYPETEQYDNFDKMSQIYTFLNDKFPNPENRTLVSLTYKFYDGGVSTLNNGFLYLDGQWNFIQGFTLNEYKEMGESYDNFSSEEEAEEKLPIFLKEKFKYENINAGTIIPVMFKLYTQDIYDLDGDGRTDDNATYSFVKNFIYDGTNWSVYRNTLEQTLQFGHDGDNWVPDNTIKYTLTSADFEFIGKELIDVYPNPADNAGYFGSFDRRRGGDNYWDDEMLLVAMNVLLEAKDPSAEEGQKYVLSFAVYTGSTGTEQMRVIKQDGEWVLNE